jgi:transposase
MGAWTPHTPKADTIGLYTVARGDAGAVMEIVRRAGAKREGTEDETPTVTVCYEAGHEGFWLHRRLSAPGIRVVVI